MYTIWTHPHPYGPSFHEHSFSLTLRYHYTFRVLLSRHPALRQQPSTLWLFEVYKAVRNDSIFLLNELQGQVSALSSALSCPKTGVSPCSTLPILPGCKAPLPAVEKHMEGMSGMGCTRSPAVPGSQRKWILVASETPTPPGKLK